MDDSQVAGREAACRQASACDGVARHRDVVADLRCDPRDRLAADGRGGRELLTARRTRGAGAPRSGRPVPGAEHGDRGDYEDERDGQARKLPTPGLPRDPGATGGPRWPTLAYPVRRGPSLPARWLGRASRRRGRYRRRRYRRRRCRRRRCRRLRYGGRRRSGRSGRRGGCRYLGGRRCPEQAGRRGRQRGGRRCASVGRGRSSAVDDYRIMRGRAAEAASRGGRGLNRARAWRAPRQRTAWPRPGWLGRPGGRPALRGRRLSGLRRPARQEAAAHLPRREPARARHPTGQP